MKLEETWNWSCKMCASGERLFSQVEENCRTDIAATTPCCHQRSSNFFQESVPTQENDRSGRRKR